MTRPFSSAIRDRRNVYAGLLLIVVLEMALGARFLHASPIGDDDDEMAYVQGAGSWSQLARGDCYGLFRPVKNVLFFAVSRMSPTSTWPRHALSEFLFVACTMLVFAWLRRRLNQDGWALAGTAAWAMAPTQVSAVAWFSCANILFGACCVLGGSLLFERFRCPTASDSIAKRRVFLLAVCGLYALAALSYESFLMMPALLLLEDSWRNGVKWRSPRFVSPYVGLFVVAILCLVTRQFAQSSFTLRNSNFGPLSSAQVSFASAWLTLDHLRVFFWPFGQQRFTATFVWGATTPVWSLVLSWVAMGGILVTAIALRRRVPLFSFGMAWFALAFLPTSNLLPVRSGPYGDYYLVIPSLGLVVAAAGLAQTPAANMKPRRLVWAPLALVTGWRIACAIVAFDWGGAWNSEELLLRRTLAARPDAFTVRAEVARVCIKSNRLDEAERSASLARAQAPWQEYAYYVLADVYLRRGQVDKATAMYRESMRVYPNGVYPYFGLGFIQETYLNDLDGAIRSYRTVLAVRWNQSSAGAAQNLCRVLVKTGRADDAAGVIESALLHEPTAPRLQYTAAVVWKQKGDLAKAQNHLDRYNKLTASSGQRVSQSSSTLRQ